MLHIFKKGAKQFTFKGKVQQSLIQALAQGFLIGQNGLASLLGHAAGENLHS